MEFDKLVHQETRLKIFAYLYRHGETKFNDLASELDVTKGNLSSHLQTIEDADCLSVKKEFVDRKPQTTYELTDTGHEKFENHVKRLEQLLNSIE